MLGYEGVLEDKAGDELDAFEGFLTGDYWLCRFVSPAEVEDTLEAREGFTESRVKAPLSVEVIDCCRTGSIFFTQGF